MDSEALSAEHKMTLIAVTLTKPIDDPMEKYSSLDQLQRVLVYIIRFTRRLKKSDESITGPLTLTVLTAAIVVLVKRPQDLHFSDEGNTVFRLNLYIV